MSDDFVLTALLLVALLFALLLILISTAMAGRKIADLEYQREAGINGVHRIQSWTNLRTHGNRVLLGLTFVVITVLLIADAPLIWRTWTNRILFAVVMVSYTISSVWDWRAERAQVRILQVRATTRQARAVTAGVEAATVEETPSDASSVDVVTIQPEAAQAIANAVKPAAVKGTLEAIADALPSRGG